MFQVYSTLDALFALFDLHNSLDTDIALNVLKMIVALMQYLTNIYDYNFQHQI